MKKLKAFLLLSILFVCAFAHANDAPHQASSHQSQGEHEDRLPDPLEPVNRGILQFNRLIDGMFLKPISMVYRAILPSPARQGISNTLNNLGTPVVALNLALQGEGSKASRQVGRFLVNSTLGIGGLFDLASPMGLKNETADFDQTMAKAGIPSGPYLVLPVIGPSTPRAVVGRIAQIIVDPFNRIMIHEGHRNYIYVRAGIQLISLRDQSRSLIEVLESDNYMYETMRNLYSQTVRVKEGKMHNEDYQGPKPSDDWGQPIPHNESYKP